MQNNPNNVKVLIVDDSMLFRMRMETSLNSIAGINVVGTAGSANEAMDKIRHLKPDVLTLDVEMPHMNGIEFLKKLLPQHFMPVLVVSSRADFAFDAIEAGAMDFEEKPFVRSPGDVERFVETLAAKIKAIHASRFRRTRGASSPAPAATATPAAPAVQPKTVAPSAAPTKFPPVTANTKAVIAIGASTGGTEAIISVVKDLPRTTPGIVIVQHMPAGFTKLYSERLNRVCQMAAREAQDGDRVEPGLILLGAGDFHLTLKRDLKGYFVRSQKGEKVSGHCPSVDVLFQSAAEEAGRWCVGAILTGMGADGAKGITQLHGTGAFTIGQDEESCVVYGMPMEAYKRGGITKQLPLSQIGYEIMTQVNKLR